MRHSLVYPTRAITGGSLRCQVSLVRKAGSLWTTFASKRYYTVIDFVGSPLEALLRLHTGSQEDTTGGKPVPAKKNTSNLAKSKSRTKKKKRKSKSKNKAMQIISAARSEVCITSSPKNFPREFRRGTQVHNHVLQDKGEAKSKIDNEESKPAQNPSTVQKSKAKLKKKALPVSSSDKARFKVSRTTLQAINMPKPNCRKRQSRVRDRSKTPVPKQLARFDFLLYPPKKRQLKRKRR